MQNSYDPQDIASAVLYYLRPLIQGKRILILEVDNPAPRVPIICDEAKQIHLAYLGEVDINALESSADIENLVIHEKPFTEIDPADYRPLELIYAPDLLTHAFDLPSILAHIQKVLGPSGILVTRCPEPSTEYQDGSPPVRELFPQNAVTWLKERFEHVNSITEQIALAAAFGMDQGNGDIPVYSKPGSFRGPGGALLFASAGKLPELDHALVLTSPEQARVLFHKLKLYSQRLDGCIREIRNLHLKLSRFEKDTQEALRQYADANAEKNTLAGQLDNIGKELLELRDLERKERAELARLEQAWKESREESESLRTQNQELHVRIKDMKNSITAANIASGRLAASLAEHGFKLEDGKLVPGPEKLKAKQENQKRLEFLEHNLRVMTEQFAGLYKLTEQLRDQLSERIAYDRLEIEKRIDEAKQAAKRQAEQEFNQKLKKIIITTTKPGNGTSSRLKTPAEKNSFVENQQRLDHLLGKFNELSKLVEASLFYVSEIEKSKRWQVGNVLGKTYRTISGKGEIPTGIQKIRETLKNTVSVLESAQKLLEKNRLSLPAIDNTAAPEQGPRPAKTVDRPESIDIVICVHNALDDVKACLDSVTRHTYNLKRLIIVNDGSSKETSMFLRKWCADHPSSYLIETKVAEGYTKAANKGLRASRADLVVLLNSDTIVPDGWLDRLVDCAASDTKIGIVGPLSNAASYQSVPDIYDGKGDWSINPLPDGYTVNDIAAIVAHVSERNFTRVEFVNGFCLAIKRSVIDAIGFLDEKSFPKGFGEENDYCLRARNAGFDLAVADHCYVYHAKSKSYSHERRKKLSAAANKAIRQKHGEARMQADIEVLEQNPVLRSMRKRVKSRLAQKRPVPAHDEQIFPKVLFLLPYFGIGGGVHSIVQEAQGMRNLGTESAVAVPTGVRDNYIEAYPEFDRSLFLPFMNETELTESAGGYDVVVATHFKTVDLLKRVHAAKSNLVPAYYVQDYEPWFVEPGTKVEQEALDSYTAIPGMVLFAKSDWLCELIGRKQGVKVHKVLPSLDRNIFHTLKAARQDEVTPLVITAMVRPATPRRAPRETMEVLAEIKRKYKNSVDIRIFGCNPEDPQYRSLPIGFPHENIGILNRREVADLLRASDIFLDLSTYQAFGLTGIEAMACGCATVLPAKGGVHEYAEHRRNALIVDTGNRRLVLDSVFELIRDSSFRNNIRKEAIRTAGNFSLNEAAGSQLKVLGNNLRSYKASRHFKPIEIQSKKTPGPDPVHENRPESGENVIALKKALQDYEKVIDSIGFYVSEVEKSMRWKVGNAIGGAYRSITAKGPLPSGMEKLKEVLNEFDGKRRAHEKAINRSISSIAASPGPKQPVETREYAGFADRVLCSLSNLGKIDVIVPVYNATADVKKCIQSLLANTRFPHRILLIDDKSTDPGIRKMLFRYRTDKRIKIMFNRQNLGFVATVNRGLSGSRNDVVVLNSDTIVTPHWLRNLAACAYSKPRIGTVTAITNAGGVFSVPRFQENNPAPEGLSLDGMARLVQRYSPRLFTPVPTAGGFCMYIKRAMLDDVGLLDEKAFIKGYGEENDLCMRGTDRGWIHVVDDSTYIYHERTASFGAGKEKLVEHNRKILEKKHPHYPLLVKEFVTGNPLRPVQEIVRDILQMVGQGDRGLVERAEKPAVLYTIHESAEGGTTRTAMDLASEISKKMHCLVLASNRRRLTLYEYQGQRMVEIERHALDQPTRVFEFYSASYRDVVFDILQRYSIDLVHVRHLLAHTMDLPKMARILGIPVVMSFHDYYYICPTIHLIDDKYHFCGGRCTRTKGQCQYPKTWFREMPRLKNAFLPIWRKAVDEMLDNCDAFVTTTKYTRDLYRQIYPKLKKRDFRIIEHGRDLSAYYPVAREPARKGPVRIVSVGALGTVKGCRFIKELMDLDKEQKFEWHFWGQVSDPLPYKGIYHGSYERDRLADILAVEHPSFGAVFSLAETYCHTLTELWACGLPIFVSDHGALKERMLSHKGGWLIDTSNPEKAYQQMADVISDRKAWAREAENARTLDFPAIEEMGDAYLGLYGSLLNST
ncbi:MAG: glycosyltransferase [Deltaproteobacteria bacterium]|nr:glycosyltransferase [Deltaproteobacteria bacterium]